MPSWNKKHEYFFSLKRVNRPAILDKKMRLFVGFSCSFEVQQKDNEACKIFCCSSYNEEFFGSKKFACCQFVTWSFPISAAKWLSAQNMAILWGQTFPPILWGADFLDKQLLVVQTILRSAHRCTLWPTYFYLLPTDSLFKPPSSISICMHRCNAGVNGLKIYKDFLFTAQDNNPSQHTLKVVHNKEVSQRKRASHQSFVLVSVV